MLNCSKSFRSLKKLQKFVINPHNNSIKQVALLFISLPGEETEAQGCPAGKITDNGNNNKHCRVPTVGQLFFKC